MSSKKHGSNNHYGGNPGYGHTSRNPLDINGKLFLYFTLFINLKDFKSQ